MSLIKLMQVMSKKSVSTPVDYTIGGTPFFIIAGQSNCGRSTVSEMTNANKTIYGPAISNAFMSNGFNYVANNQSPFVQLDPGLNTMLGNPQATDEFGPETSLALSLQNYASKNRYYCKVAVGNTSLAGDWLPGAFRYNAMLTVLDQALTGAATLGITNLKLHGFIWMQGENDAVDINQSNNYSTNLNLFFEQFTNWWANTKGMNANYKKIIGRIQDINAGNEEIIRAAQESFCANQSNNAILINTDTYTLKDSIHFDANSQIKFGQDIFEQVKNL